MFERIKALMERWHDIKEINDLTEHDLDDLGMSREQVLAFARMPHDISDRVKHMGRVFGIPDTALQLDHNSYLEILSTCGSCRDRSKCAHLLAREDAVPQEASFCLNAEVFAAEAERPAA